MNTSVILIFIDGIGYGANDRNKNPFARYQRKYFSFLGGKEEFSAPGIAVKTDASLGIPGIPQSGTGQTSLFTGHNGAEIMGRHVAGFPPYTLRPYLKNESIIKAFVDNGLKASVVNTYTERYLDLIKKPRSERFLSASTLVQLGSGQDLLTLEDQKNGKSIFMDITNWFLRSMHPEIQLESAYEQGKKLVKIARSYNLILFEYFFPDKIGHDGNMQEAERILDHLNDFFAGIWDELNIDSETVIVCSDHGNFEDLSTAGHTKNKVPTIVYGYNQDWYGMQVDSIYDIPRSIKQQFKIK